MKRPLAWSSSVQDEVWGPLGVLPEARGSIWGEGGAERPHLTCLLPTGGNGRHACRRHWALSTYCCHQQHMGSCTCPCLSVGTSSGSAQVGNTTGLLPPPPPLCPTLSVSLPLSHICARTTEPMWLVIGRPAESVLPPYGFYDQLWSCPQALTMALGIPIIQALFTRGPCPRGSPHSSLLPLRQMCTLCLGSSL